ncbi:hypothetical protein E2C01_034394 [Portunus trituberculatus]|uniref:Secreted protein n=1 Tax=Portunus trituberculatus TaxID=210409 RepID=A0A5B7F5F5_PORTR|nr:hypothetical protein [Portunus trituberculatus]
MSWLFIKHLSVFFFLFLFFPVLPLSAAGCLQTLPLSTTSCWGGEVVAGATMLYTTARESTHPPKQLRARSRGRMKTVILSAPVCTTPCRGVELVTRATMLYTTIVWDGCDVVCFMSDVPKTRLDEEAGPTDKESSLTGSRNKKAFVS